MNNINSKDVTLVVPFYNEERSIVQFLEKITSFDRFFEIICVDDGSTDTSNSLVRPFADSDKITLVELQNNMGKGFAMAEGVSQSRSDVIMFLDADLRGISLEVIDSMLNPFLTGNAEVVIGYMGDDVPGSIVFRKIAGQRIYFKKDLVPLLDQMKKSRFGVEILLNEALKDKKTEWIKMKGVSHLLKTQKYNTVDAFKDSLREIVEVGLEIGNREVFSPEDLVIIRRLKEVNSFSEFRIKVKGLKNGRVRSIFEDYINKYLNAMMPKR